MPVRERRRRVGCARETDKGGSGVPVRKRHGRVRCARDRDMGGSGVPVRQIWEGPVCP